MHYTLPPPSVLLDTDTSIMCNTLDILGSTGPPAYGGGSESRHRATLGGRVVTRS